MDSLHRDGQFVPGRTRVSVVISACAALAVASLALGCANGSNNPGGEGGSGGSASGSGGTGGAGATGGAGGAGGGSGGAGGAAMPAETEIVLAFNPAVGELAEGLAIDGTTAYLSMSVLRQIWKVDLTTGTKTEWATVPGALGAGFLQGLLLDAQKNLYIAMSSGDPAMAQPGIYKVGPAGGTATLFAQHANMVYPRSIASTSFGKMYVTEPDQGYLFEVSTSGAVAQVPQPAGSSALSWDSMSMCAFGLGVRMGISSLFVSGASKAAANFYWTNGDRASIFQGFIVNDPDVGPALAEVQPPILGPDCATAGGAESLIEDPVDQTFLFASRQSNKIVRMDKKGTSVQTVAEGKNFYEPSAIAIATLDGKRYVYFVNSAYKTYKTGGIPSLARVALPN